MRYCFDIDGTICDTPDGKYHLSTPKQDVIDRINQLHDEGHYIIFQTARGSKSGIDWNEITVSQLDDWGVKYDWLMPMFSKPDADIFIDDKGVNIEDWMNG